MSKKGYNNINKLLKYKNIIDIVNTHYRSGITTYAGIFREYVLPVYPMSYKTFMKIINMTNINTQIEKEKQRINGD